MIPPRTAYYFINAKSLNTEHFGNLRTANAVSMKSSYFNNLSHRELAAVAIFAKSAPALNGHVSLIVLNGAKPQVGRINTQTVVSKRTVVKNPFSVRWTVMDNPTYDMCTNSPVKWIAPTNDAITMVPCLTDPQMTSTIVRNIKHFFVKSFEDTNGKTLRVKEIVSNMVGHIKSLFFAVLAPWRLQSPGASFILR